MKKKLTKKEQTELYESFNKKVNEYRKQNRKRIIETEIIPYLLQKTFQEKHYMLQRNECVERAKKIFEEMKADNCLDELYNLKG